MIMTAAASTTNQIHCAFDGNTYVGPIATKLALRPLACIDGEYYTTEVLRAEPCIYFNPVRKTGEPKLHGLTWGSKSAIKAVEDGTIQLINR